MGKVLLHTFLVFATGGIWGVVLIVRYLLKRGERKMKFHLTKYMDGNDGKYYAESWVQINIFGKCFCLFKRKIELYPKPSEIL